MSHLMTCVDANPCRCQLCQTLGGIYMTEYLGLDEEEDEGKPCQSPGRMKNSSYYIAPVGVRTHDLPHTVASNMIKVSHALH